MLSLEAASEEKWNAFQAKYPSHINGFLKYFTVPIKIENDHDLSKRDGLGYNFRLFKLHF